MNNPQESNQEKSQRTPMEIRPEVIRYARLYANAVIPAPVEAEQPRYPIVEQVVTVKPLAYTEQAPESQQPATQDQATVTDINAWREQMKNDAYAAAENARKAA